MLRAIQTKMAGGARSRQVARGAAGPVCALGTSLSIRSACRRAQEHGIAITGVPLRQVQIPAGHADYATTGSTTRTSPLRAMTVRWRSQPIDSPLTPL